jgi:hypothetical protein
VVGWACSWSKEESKAKGKACSVTENKWIKNYSKPVISTISK